MSSGRRPGTCRRVSASPFRAPPTTSRPWRRISPCLWSSTSWLWSSESHQDFGSGLEKRYSRGVGFTSVWATTRGRRRCKLDFMNCVWKIQEKRHCCVSPAWCFSHSRNMTIESAQTLATPIKECCWFLFLREKHSSKEHAFLKWTTFVFKAFMRSATNNLM